MPKAKAVEKNISLEPENPGTPRPRLHKLIVKNFRAIGLHSLEIELDDIVVLVGPNNSGKSSILRAYEVVMKHGSNEGKLKLDDFPNGVVTVGEYPQIELQTIVFDNAPGERWLQKTAEGEWLIREQWLWKSPNEQPQRRGFDVQTNDWSDQVPWGAPNIANSRRPLPHRVEAFASPEVQSGEIVELLQTVLKEKLKTIKTTGPEQEKSDYEVLLEKIAAFQVEVAKSAESEAQKIENEVSNLLEKVFPKHRIKLDAKPESDVEKAYSPFKVAPDLLMGPSDGYFSKVSQQGSGARRTLIWAALKYLSEFEADKGANTRPHVLLMDEPEICLHPTAIREACKVLYGLPETKNWQVMLTTHSPIFIDLSRDNTTVIRVERQSDNEVHTITLYRPTKARLDDDDRKNLKALNACDPHVNEFFFGGRVIVVEGDTEYTAFSILRNAFPERYKGIHVIRARGKGSILTIMKILNQFSSAYAVLHDADVPLTSEGKASPSWGVNKSIRESIEHSVNPAGILHVVSVLDFERALFGKAVPNEKPYNTMVRLLESTAMMERAAALLDALLDGSKAIPDGFHKWTSLDQLEALVTSYLKQ